VRWYPSDKLKERGGTAMTADSNNHAEEIKEIHNRLNAYDKKIKELKKQLDTKDPYKPTGKGKKAKNKLDEVGEAIKKIKEQLDNARNAFITIIVAVPKQAFSEIEKIDEKKSEEIWEELKTKGYFDENAKITDKFKPNEQEFKLNLTSLNDVDEQNIIKILEQFKDKENDIRHGKKKRTMVTNVQKRIEFNFNHMKFYIDFTVVASERDDQSNIKGGIIYGASRTLCFSECIFPNNQNNCKECQRTVRCDSLEDKPLISFEVTQHGMITSSGKLEGEWWIKDKPDLDELHYRALDLIWKDALDWTNEIILP
jgi:hypothetical protein